MQSLIIVQKIFKVLSIISIIAFVIIIVGAVGVLIGGIALLFVPYLGEDVVKLVISTAEVESISGLSVSLIAESVFLAGQAVAMWFVFRYFKHELVDGTPFTYRGAKELRTLGIIQLAVPFGALFICTLITAVAGVKNTISNEFDIISGIVMILLSYVFAYGADLKKKAEEADIGNK